MKRNKSITTHTTTQQSIIPRISMRHLLISKKMEIKRKISNPMDPIPRPSEKNKTSKCSKPNTASFNQSSPAPGMPKTASSRCISIFAWFILASKMKTPLWPSFINGFQWLGPVRSCNCATGRAYSWMSPLEWGLMTTLSSFTLGKNTFTSRITTPTEGSKGKLLSYRVLLKDSWNR